MLQIIQSDIVTPDAQVMAPPARMMGLLPKKAPDESSFCGTSQTRTRFLNLRDLAARWRRAGLPSN